MWPGRYFPERYWNARYWTKTGVDAASESTTRPTVRVRLTYPDVPRLTATYPDVARLPLRGGNP